MRKMYDTEEIQTGAAQSALLFDSHAQLNSYHDLAITVPMHPIIWSNIVEYTLEYLLVPVFTADSKHRIIASVFLTQAPLKHRDWIDEYKQHRKLDLNNY